MQLTLVPHWVMPDVYTPPEIERHIGLRVLRENGPLMEWITEEHVRPANYIAIDGEVYEESDDELADRIYELAQVCREEGAQKYPENEFRYVSRLQKDHSTSYWYEIALTEEGERARDCWKHLQCCDHRGNLDVAATIAYWHKRLENRHIAVTFLKGLDAFGADLRWLHETWAEPISLMIDYRLCGIITDLSGAPDYEKTLEEWLRWTSRQSPQSLANDRKELFSLDETWAQPIHDAVMVGIMRAKDVALV